MKKYLYPEVELRALMSMDIITASGDNKDEPTYDKETGEVITPDIPLS
ncbi:MAG: hypothetical protein J6A53_07670 [Clostridia bacterium]|nr:hypothetical protein [Clostridia bacterium]